jgi:predicted ATP-binding protein involved in virulence
MRLQKVWISEYKNLKNFTLTFDGNSFIDVFVGKNGTGKSNLFEALIEIFRHLYEFDKSKYDIPFEYSIKYEIVGTITEISWKNERLSIDDNERKTIGKTPLPDNVLIYYSGHNTKVTELVKAYEVAFKPKVQWAKPGQTRKFIGIGKEYKQLLLSVLLLQEDTNKARQFICSKLGIAAIDAEAKIVLCRPYFADKKIVIDEFDQKTHYWGALGSTRFFLDNLLQCIKTAFKHSDIYDSNKDQYEFNLNIEKFKNIFNGNSSQEIFRQFDNLKTIEMLKELSIKLTLQDGTQTTTHAFSDGQFQSVYIYSIIELFKDRNCITLLDEPDCFLHPEWQFEFLKQVFEITDATTKNNHVLMSSHSASTIMLLEDSYLNLFEIKDNSVNHSKVCKKSIIDSLSKGFIKYSENESLLRINNAIRMSQKPVLFVEGITDVVILEIAYKKLYGNDDLPVLIQDVFDRGSIKKLLSRGELFENYPGKIFFGLFDFDDAYDDWRDIHGVDQKQTLDKGLCKKLNDKPAFAFILPVPNNALKDQVWDDQNQVEKVKPNPCFCIEHLFWGVQGMDAHFKEQIVNGNKKIVLKGDKVKFAERVVPTLPPQAFEPFRPMFEFINATCTVQTDNAVS